MWFLDIEMRMDRVKMVIAVLAAVSTLITGCSGEKGPVLSEYELPVEDTYFYNNCAYDDLFFYEVYYGDSLVDQTNGKKLMDKDSDETDTEIHCYNMSEKTDKTVYRIGGGCVKTEYMAANSKYVFWETADDNGWHIYYLDYRKSGSPKILVEQEAKGTLSAVCFTVTDDACYWYDVSENGEAAIWMRRFGTSINEKFAGDASLSTPYIEPTIVDDQIGYIEKNNGGYALVVKNTEGKETFRKAVDSAGGNVLANSSWCVWRGDDDSAKTIYLCDRKSGKKDSYDMGKDRFFSYALLGDYLIVNVEKASGASEIRAVNLKNRRETCLKSEENESYGYTAQFKDRISFDINRNGENKIMIGLIR